jgi:hypothetical protein
MYVDVRMYVCSILQIEALNADYEKLQKANGKLQKVSDNLEDEKLFLQAELNRVAKDAEIRCV